MFRFYCQGKQTATDLRNQRKTKWMNWVAGKPLFACARVFPNLRRNVYSERPIDVIAVGFLYLERKDRGGVDSHIFGPLTCHWLFRSVSDDQVHRLCAFHVPGNAKLLAGLDVIGVGVESPYHRVATTGATDIDRYLVGVIAAISDRQRLVGSGDAGTDLSGPMSRDAFFVITITEGDVQGLDIVKRPTQCGAVSRR